MSVSQTLDLGAFTCLSFDCYGTLIDWEAGIVAALEPVFTAHGVAPAAEAVLAAYARAESEIEAGPYRRYRAVLERVLARLGETFGFTPSASEAAAFAASVGNWPPFPDSRAALAALARRYRATLGDPFAAVFTAERIGSYKPDRRNFEYLIAHAGAPRDKILHVAQSLFHDIAPARALGLRTVWVNRRRGRAGSGATPAAEARADAEVPDLRTLADRAATP